MPRDVSEKVAYDYQCCCHDHFHHHRYCHHQCCCYDHCCYYCLLPQVSAAVVEEQAAGADDVASMMSAGGLQHPSTATAAYNCFYQPYLARQQQEVAQLKRDEALVVPNNLDYTSLQLSGEDREKLSAARPRTLAQAQRIPGVTPQAVILLLQLSKRHQQAEAVRQRHKALAGVFQ